MVRRVQPGTVGKPPDRGPQRRVAKIGLVATSDREIDDYTENLTVVARHTPDQFSGDVWEEALVLELEAGDLLDLRGLNGDVNRWLIDEQAEGHNYVEVRRRGNNVGASGVEVAIIVSLIGGGLGGISGKMLEFVWDEVATRMGRKRNDVPVVVARFEDLDGMRYAVARAMDARPSELKLVEGHLDPERHAAIFEDASGNRYGIKRWSDGGLFIRRLAEDEEAPPAR